MSQGTASHPDLMGLYLRLFGSIFMYKKTRSFNLDCAAIQWRTKDSIISFLNKSRILSAIHTIFSLGTDRNWNGFFWTDRITFRNRIRNEKYSHTGINRKSLNLLISHFILSFYRVLNKSSHEFNSWIWHVEFEYYQSMSLLFLWKKQLWNWKCEIHKTATKSENSNWQNISPS